MKIKQEDAQNHEAETPEQKLENERRQREAMLYAKVQSCYVPDVFKTPKSLVTMSVG